MKVGIGAEDRGALGSEFKTATDKAGSSRARDKARRKLPRPFSIRFTEEEKARLEREAGTRSLAAHIRLKLFGDAASLRDQWKPSRKRPLPPVDRQALGKALGELGKSRLASNLNQIAKAANIGTLPVTADLIDEVRGACADVRSMRRALMTALGLKPEDRP